MIESNYSGERVSIDTFGCYLISMIGLIFLVILCAVRNKQSVGSGYYQLVIEKAVVQVCVVVGKMLHAFSTKSKIFVNFIVEKQLQQAYNIGTKMDGCGFHYTMQMIG